MASKKSGGSTKNGRKSISKRLGIKKYNNQYVLSGNIIIRQKGTKFIAGNNVSIGKDYTIYSLLNGYVSFKYNNFKNKFIVNVF